MSNAYVYGAISVMALATIVPRALPFLAAPFFKKSTSIKRLGETLPAAILVILVAYCLSSVSILKWPYGAPEFLALGLCVLLHFWRRNALLSIAFGTACYVLALQVWVA